MLRCFLLGRASFECNGKRLAQIDTTPLLQELLAFLALHGHSNVDRRVIATALWEDINESIARQNLSANLWRLKRAFVAVGVDSPVIIMDAQTVRINEAVPIWTDINEFSILAQSVFDAPASESITAIEDALRTYGGELLPSVDSTWLVSRRSKHQKMRFQLTDWAGNHCHEAGRYDQAIEFWYEALNMEPLCESLYVKLTQALITQGRMTDARTLFDQYRKRWSTELELPPTRQMMELAFAFNLDMPVLIDEAANVNGGQLPDYMSPTTLIHSRGKPYSRIVTTAYQAYQRSAFQNLLDMAIVLKDANEIDEARIWFLRALDVYALDGRTAPTRLVYEARRHLDEIYDQICDRSSQRANLAALAELSNLIDVHDFQCDSRLRHAWFYLQMERPRDALGYVSYLMPMLTPESAHLSAAKRIMGICHFELGRFEDSVKAYEEALTLDRNMSRTEHFRVNLISLASGLNAIGDIDAASDALTQAESLVDSSTDNSLLARLRTYRGIIAMKRRHFDVAEASFASALTLTRKLLDTATETWIGARIVSMYRRMGAHDRAVTTALRYLDIAVQLREPRGAQIDLCDQLAQVYYEQCDLKACSTWVNSMYAYVSGTQVERYKIPVLIRKAQMHLLSADVDRARSTACAAWRHFKARNQRCDEEFEALTVIFRAIGMDIPVY
jgi:DNA-binding SARP family transcriptional activator